MQMAKRRVHLSEGELNYRRDLIVRAVMRHNIPEPIARAYVANSVTDVFCRYYWRSGKLTASWRFSYGNKTHTSMKQLASSISTDLLAAGSWTGS